MFEGRSTTIQSVSNEQLCLGVSGARTWHDKISEQSDRDSDDSVDDEEPYIQPTVSYARVESLVEVDSHFHPAKP